MMIKAIETVYKGYRFRSRLEARWAVFFDAMGFDWSYEPQGFDLGKLGWYLPDFVLRAGDGNNTNPNPDNGEAVREYFFVEIKGGVPTDEEVDKLSEVCSYFCCYGAILYGNIPLYTKDNHGVSSIHKEGGVVNDDGSADDFWSWIGTCQSTHIGYVDSYRFDKHAMDLANFALERARSARFEHGENGSRKRPKNEERFFVPDLSYLESKFYKDLEKLENKFLKGKKCWYDGCKAEPRNIGDFNDWDFDTQKDVVSKCDLDWTEKWCIPVCHQHYHENNHDGYGY